ncbi:MAG: AAA family ATPase, partial [Nitrospira sp.]
MIYEPAALKRLMGRYATREDALDRLLRAERFIDVYGVTRQALRASVERYSLKDLETLYGFERQVPLVDASMHLRAFEHAIELGRLCDIPKGTPTVIEGYNREDCLSTMLLRDWLEQLRAGAIDDGSDIPRPALKAGDPSENIDERQRRVQQLYERLAGDVAADPDQRTDEQQARWLLANMLDWHRREKKAVWWEYFRLNGLPDEELVDEKAGLAGLTFHGTIARPGRSVIDRYRFPPQECEIRAGDKLQNRDQGSCGSVERIDTGYCFIDIKKGPSIASKHPPSFFRHTNIDDDVKAAAIMRLAEWVAEHGIDTEGPYRAARNLLLRRSPRPAIALGAEQGPLAYARTWVEALDHSILPIQGPPGSGKTYTGANMITSLVRSGRKVGIVALSHKVIRNLLANVVRRAAEERTLVMCVQKVAERSDKSDPWIAEVTDNASIQNGLRSGAINVAAGTAWLWSREEMFDAVDVLFVDEAGQLSLADVLAVSQSAGSIVLLGDPQQLKQPLQGSHPEGTEVSALEHLLDHNKTLPSGA